MEDEVVTVIRTTPDGIIEREEMFVLCAIEAVLDDPDNDGKRWCSARICTYDLVDLGKWDRSP